MRAEFEQTPSLDEVMRQRHSDWEHMPIEKQAELVVDWLMEQFKGEQGEKLRRALSLDSPGTDTDSDD